MGIESTGRVLDFMKARKKKVDFLLAEKQKGQARSKRVAGRYFYLKKIGEWVENACTKCNGGMSKQIYDFQQKNRPGGAICSVCSKKEDKRALKELDRDY